MKLYNKCSYQLEEIKDNSIDALITDPPYGISYQNNYWDKDLPSKQIWENSFEKLKYGSFGLVFSSVRLMHRLMVDLEDSGFIIKDVLFWSYLNGMPKSRNVGLGIKPAYEPIILIQKPLKKGLNVAQNIIKYGTGALNFENSRIPYQDGEGKVGHNPHPKGRVPSNIIRTDSYNDGYDKFFVVPKVRQKKDNFNFHPTLKPVELMHHLIKLITFEKQSILDPFMGSGSTGVGALELKRDFIGYELDEDYFEIAQKRIDICKKDLEYSLF